MTQPYLISTGGQNIIEIGNSAANVDFLTAEEIGKVFASYINQRKRNPHQALVFHVGIHQETAWKYMPRMNAALRIIYYLSAKHEIALRPFSLPTEKSLKNGRLTTQSH